MHKWSVVDAHQHFWKLERGDYGWLDESLGCLYRDYLPDELKAHLETCGVKKTIVVQAAPTLAETLYLLELTQNLPFVAGVVGWVDMESRHVKADLTRLAQHAKFLGIRPMIQDIDDPDWMLKPEFESAFTWLIENERSFDALVKPAHLPNLKIFLARYPDLRVVIDHGAKPCIERGEFEFWAAHMTDIASDSHAYCKISGLLTEAGELGTAEALRPYVNHLLSAFGADRCIWGSDWPVLNLAADYSSWFTMVRELIGGLTEKEQRQVMGETAMKFYGLSHDG
ncbi:amidohydrolase family protein [Sansalvadorimonas verongulae]|uniref:amidohydrolase family protein n=1 Tax=Sansalvadorimonas verongulae TaxID=2172824 RepID=UPI0012BCC324|nr:amidohydrolase family protein [Sansalvadorimonas verongulae]MTI15201.1 amidohydrolase [Sansalvadorimonas verongulae]